MNTPTLTKAERANIAHLYDLIISHTTSIADLKQSKKSLHQILNKHFIDCWQVLEHKNGVAAVLKTAATETDVKRLVELIRVIGHMSYYFKAPLEFNREMKGLILHWLVHESGSVRDTAKRLIGSWRLHDGLHQKDPAPLVIEFITELVVLIHKHTPADVLVPVEQRPPSVYKSLLLAYEEIVRGLTTENFVASKPDLQIIVLHEVFEPVYDRSTQIPLLWSVHQCEAATLSKSAKLAEEAAARLQFFLEQATFTTKEIINIRSRLTMADTPFDQELVIEHIVLLASEKQIIPHLLGPIVREIQLITNHTVRNQKGVSYTYTLVSARTAWTEDKRPIGINWNDWSQYLFSVHAAIDGFFNDFVSAETEKLAAMYKRIARYTSMSDEGSDHAEDILNLRAQMLDCCSIAHHILDWLLQEAPNFTTKTPEKLAAICYGVVHEKNQGVVPYTTKELAAFGLWKAAGSIRYSVLTVTMLLEEVIADPTLLMTIQAIDFMAETEEDDEAIVVSSPLGTINDVYLRFYVVVSSSQSISIVDHARLRRACDAEAATGTCVVESTLPYSTYAVLLLGLHYDVPPQTIIDNIIIAANGTKPFLRFHFLMTNTHVPSQKEIDAYLKSLR